MYISPLRIKPNPKLFLQLKEKSRQFLLSKTKFFNIVERIVLVPIISKLAFFSIFTRILTVVIESYKECFIECIYTEKESNRQLFLDYKRNIGHLLRLTRCNVSVSNPLIMLLRSKNRTKTILDFMHRNDSIVVLDEYIILSFLVDYSFSHARYLHHHP